MISFAVSALPETRQSYGIICQAIVLVFSVLLALKLSSLLRPQGMVHFAAADTGKQHASSWLFCSADDVMSVRNTSVHHHLSIFSLKPIALKATELLQSPLHVRSVVSMTSLGLHAEGYQWG